MRTSFVVLTVVFLLLLSFVPANAAGTHKEQEESPTINISLGPVVDAIQNLVSTVEGFFNNFEDRVVNAIKTILFKPFELLAEALVDLLTGLITWYPNVQDNSSVRDLHGQTLLLAFAFAAPALAATGVLLITGTPLGLSYRQVRLIVPRIVIGLAFAAVAPWALQRVLELSRLLTLAFQPTSPDALATFSLSLEMIVVTVVDSLLLLAVAALFIVRNIYFMFATAAAPLIAVAWAVPYFRGFASQLIGAFWAFVIIGPVDMLIFNLTLSLLEGTPNAPDYLLSLGGILLMLGVPLLLLGQAGGMLGVIFGFVGSARSSASSLNRRVRGQSGGGESATDPHGPNSHRRNRRNYSNDRSSGENKFDKEVILSD